MKGWRLVVAVAAVTAMVAIPGRARAEEYPESAGWGVLAILGNVVYMPVKTVYASLGGLTGGLAYVCTGGNYDTASDIWQTSLGGNYVLTPGMMRGDEPIAFAGASSSATPESSATPPEEQPSQRSRRDARYKKQRAISFAREWTCDELRSSLPRSVWRRASIHRQATRARAIQAIPRRRRSRRTWASTSPR